MLTRQISRSLPELLFTAALSLTMFSVAAGGCFQPEDTFVNYTNASANSGSGVGAMGGAGPGPNTPREFFEQEVLPLMNGEPCGKCHNSGTEPFLTTGLEYATISTYTTKSVAPGSPLIVANPTASVLYQYPGTVEHTGTNWDNGHQELRAKTLEWLELEAEFLDPEQLLEIGPISPDGLVVLPLDSLAPELDGYNMTFYATEHGTPPALLELTQISLWPPSGRGLRVVNTSFVVYPDVVAAPFVDTSFHGDPQFFVAPNDVQVGPGDLLITTWGDNYKLSVRFEELTALFADENGQTYSPCTRVDLFVEGVDALPIKSGTNSSNGLLYCADQCHGGVKGNNPTDVMNLEKLLTNPPDYEFACAIARVFMTPTNVDGSQMIASTDPMGNALHKAQFAFAGNSSSHAAFKNAMAPWINAEGAEEE